MANRIEKIGLSLAGAALDAEIAVSGINIFTVFDANKFPNQTDTAFTSGYIDKARNHDSRVTAVDLNNIAMQEIATTAITTSAFAVGAGLVLLGDRQRRNKI